MKTRLLIIIGCIGIIAVGFYLNFEYYQSTIHPLNLANNNLNDIVTSSEHTVISTHLFEIKQNLMLVMEKLPEDKNPVWMFPTETTNFLRIEDDVNRMITMTKKISTVPKDSSVYYTGILEIDQSSLYIQENIADAKGFLYASATNVFFTLVWLLGVTGLTEVWIRK
ncbi:MAG: hypothetical protein IIC67_00600 [Thaumarchaeota archaeon]|nr:hypothetical protein [Nitrososphaerota archaeon]